MEKALELTPQVLWSAAIEAFLWSRKVMGVTEATLSWHDLSLKLYLRCHAELNLNCPSPQTCPPDHLRHFLNWLQNRGVRLVSQQTYFKSLKVFFRFLMHEGLRDDDPTARVPMPKPETPLPRTVTEEHFAKTIATLLPDGVKSVKVGKVKFEVLRNVTLFVLAFDTGARLGELLSLKIGDIDLQKRFAIVRGKGRKERLIFFGSTTAGLISKWLVARHLKLDDLSADGYLFCFKNGSPLSIPYVNRVWRKAQKKAGLNPLPFHGLRHGFARLWLIRGGDAFSLQLILGHSSNTTTRRYVTLWGHDLLSIYQRISPIDRLKL